MRTWVVEKEQKNERNKPMFQILGPEGLSLEEVRDSTQSIIQESVIVAQILGNGVYRVQLNSEHAGKKLLAMHMRKLEGTERPFQVTMLEQQLTIMELFEMLHQKLASREKVDTYQNPWEKQTRQVGADNTQRQRKPEKRRKLKCQCQPPRNRCVRNLPNAPTHFWLVLRWKNPSRCRM